MTFVVTENCIKCKFTDCVDVCPVDCFHEGPNFLVIDPDECIDCSLCEPECPVNAIRSEDEVPEDQQQFIELNKELAKIWPTISEVKDALPDADDWKEATGKLQYLDKSVIGEDKKKHDHEKHNHEKHNHEKHGHDKHGHEKHGHEKHKK